LEDYGGVALLRDLVVNVAGVALDDPAEIADLLLNSFDAGESRGNQRCNRAEETGNETLFYFFRESHRMILR